jgi:O-antigen/teichoic acid export membrane protein
VLSPLVARQAAEGGPESAQGAVDLVAGWIATAAVPALFVLLAFRHELFSLYGQPSAAAFFPLMLAGPLASCVFGLSGNVLLMTGFARVNLAVTLAAMLAGLALALALVPPLGAAGAALAGAASQVGLVLVLTREARRRLGIRVGPAPFLAALADGLVLAAAGAVLEVVPRGASAGAPDPPALAIRVGVALAALAAFSLLRRRRLRKR